MKIILGNVDFYELDFDTEDLIEARQKAIEWFYNASGDDKINKSKGCSFVQELDNGILVKIEEDKSEREIARDYDGNIVYCQCGKPLYIDDIDEENNLTTICEATDCEY